MTLGLLQAWEGSLIGAAVLIVILGALPVWLLCRKPRIRFFANNGNAAENKVCERGEQVELPVLGGRTCHVFDAWYYDSAFTRLAPKTLTLGKRGVIKLYAKWLKKVPPEVLVSDQADDSASTDSKPEDTN